ncbi:MAG: M24 family metallopeptidase, partial [Zestosphaera sp.]
YFIHSLGHGVGLEIHERPRLAQGIEDTLVEGMVVTVEPGIYIHNRFGIRLENLVVVRKSKAEVLNRLPLIISV